VLAKAVVETLPLPFVTPMGVVSPADAPLAGGTNATVTPDTPLPKASSTMTPSGVANEVFTTALCGLPVATTIVAAAPAVFVSENVVLLPLTVAVTLYGPPATPLAVAVTLACPLFPVVAVAPPRTADAPLPGAEKETDVFGRRSPAASFTTTTRGPPKGVPTVAVCGVPLTTAIDAGGPRLVSENEAVVATPLTEAESVYVPGVPFAVPVTLATPEAFVTAVALLSPTEGPDDGGVKVTRTPESGSPRTSFTTTANGEPKAVFTSVLCAPPPETATVAGGPMKFAPTLVRPAIVRVHEAAVPNDAHAPVQPLNVQPAEGVSVRTTLDPSMKLALVVVQATPQLRPDGLEVIVPPSDEFLVTVSVSAVPRLWLTTAELLVVLGSVVPPGAAMVTRLFTVAVPVPACTLAVTVYVTEAPEGRFTLASLMLPLPLAAQDPPEVPAQVQVAPVSWEGRASVTVAPVTPAGPAFEAVIV